MRKTRVCWKEKSRRIPGEFSSTTSQLHRIREEYFIQLPFVRRNREGGTSQPLLTPIPLLRIINGQFAASAADCIVSPFSGFPSFGCQTLSLSTLFSLLCPSSLLPHFHSTNTASSSTLSFKSSSRAPFSFSSAESFKVR